MRMIEVSADDAISPQRLLPGLRLALKADNRQDVVMDIKASLGQWVCQKYFQDDTPPKRDEIIVNLKREKLADYLTEADVLAGWYLYHFDSDPCYHVMEQLSIETKPTEEDVQNILNNLKAQTVNNILKAKDEFASDDVERAEAALRELKKITLKDVLPIWHTCRKYGVPPFIER